MGGGGADPGVEDIARHVAGEAALGRGARADGAVEEGRIGDHRHEGVGHEPGGGAVGGLGQVGGDDAGAIGKAVVVEVAGGERQDGRIELDEGRLELGVVGERDERGHPCPGAELEEGLGLAADCRAEQHGIEAGAKAVLGLGDGKPAAKEGIGARRLTFYKTSALV